MAVVINSFHSALQNVIETLFRVPIPTISHFDLLGIKSEKKLKLLKIFITSISDFFQSKKGLHRPHTLHVIMYD